MEIGAVGVGENVKIGNSMISWCEPLKRRHLSLVSGDMEKALIWFKEQTGVDTTVVILHPKNSNLTSEVPEGIEVRISPRAMRWETLLASSESEPVARGKFDIQNDKSIIIDGGFFCEGCLAGKSLREQSSDPRYCQGCYQFLSREAAILPANKRPAWRPKDGQSKHQKTDKKQYHREQHMVSIMSIVDDKKNSMDIIPLSASKTTYAKSQKRRGPKPKSLPVAEIRKMGKTMGARAIASRLTNQGISISYKTVERILKDERVLL